MNETIKNIDLDFVLISLIFRLILFLANDSAELEEIAPAEDKFTASNLFHNLSARAPPY